jgi:formylglycine-generating enzyme required for sulfatase activity
LANYEGSTTSYTYDKGPNGYNAIGSVGGTPATSPVGSFAANGYGLYDMAGNVFEWCWDRYDDDELAGGSDPHGSVTGLNRVLRGGDWHDGAGRARCARRDHGFPEDRLNGDGFRAVLAPGQ